ncbi:ATP-binding cassette domain-containing protein [Halovenus sp. WSH3]|uniref:Probable branched-chain amino acid transport ATP-binding protein LivG n=1 Tax=Halovenus carboxidivorans TaxID=2692199 RepID=A0A6B0T3L5_9EURY|nr:ABC transporter ATP-binding protein [Halovenus carboxidivorans]MXR50063.1 ATP-binding cassette domain-containing protein [Halovenus carboxidivorans]
MTAQQSRTADADSETDAILSVQDLRKSFGGITAVDGVSFEIEPGSITGLIGPNGAGKSTTFNLISGAYTPDSGTIVFDGTDITGYRPDRVATRGLVRSFQIARELPEMSVLENVMLAPQHQLGETLYRSVLPGFRSGVETQERELRERAWETLEFFEIDHLATENAGNLSGGQRKLLEMARVLMTDPEMILLDEPLAGVNPTLEQKLIERLHELKADGYTFLFVEHDMDIVMNNCDPIIVMHQGQKLAEGAPETIKEDDRVLEAYLGGEVEQ